MTAAPPAQPLLPAAPANTYWALSRSPRYSLLFALPLLVAYEGLAALLGGGAGGGVRNGADVWLKTPFILLLGATGPLAFGALVLLVALVLIARDLRRSRRPLRSEIF